MSFGSLASRSFGQHRSIVFINAKTLEDAKYYLKTQLGVSDRSYKHCRIFPIYGSGQGAGNSPAIWCVISTILFDAYDEKANGATFQSPDGRVQAQIFMVGFVDDTSGSVNDFDLPRQASMEHYINRAQSDAQRWHDILRTSGGALKTTKCSYHFLYFSFTVDGTPHLKSGRVGPQITIQFHPHEPPCPLRQLSAYESHKTLGVQKAPSSTDRSLFQAMLKKNTTHTQVMARSPFTRTDAWAYYHAVYLPSITYPMPSSCLSDRHCNALQRQFKKVLLSKASYNRCTPNAVVYGSSAYGGIGLRALSTERGVSQVYMFLACLRSEGIHRQLAHIMISWGQCLAGTSFSILDNVTIPLPHLVPMQWLPQVRQYLSSIQCRIELEQTLIPSLQRINDSFIMDHALSFTESDTELLMINACRLYLGSVFISDITTCNGTTITNESYQGIQSTTSSLRDLNPYQERPSIKAWNSWRRFLDCLFASGGRRTRRLAQPLGPWIKTGSNTHRKWHSYLCLTSSRLFVYTGTTFRIYQPKFGWFFPTSDTTILVPSASVPVTYRTYPGGILLPLAHSPPQPPPESPSLPTFASHVATLSPWERNLLQGFSFGCSADEFCGFLQNQVSILAVSDGSAPMFCGSFGVQCTTLDNQPLFSMSGPAPGFRTSSFRAESYGFLAILRAIFHVCQFYQLALPSDLALYTDSQSLVDTVTKRLEWLVEYPYSTMTSDWDIQQSISHSIRQFDSCPSVQHVKGHQDRSASVETLPLPAQLNIQADSLAGSFSYPHDISSQQCALIAGSAAILHGPNGTISSNYRANLRRLSSDPIIIDYMQTKYKWSYQVFHLVDWEIHSSVIRANFGHRHFITKFVHGWLPLGKLTQHYASHYLATCPNCPDSLEDVDHFLRCSHRQNWTGPLFDEMFTFWSDKCFDPTLQSVLHEALLLWLGDSPMVFPSVPVAYRVLIARQASVGWQHLFFGRFVRDWASLQDQYVRARGLNPSKFSGSCVISGTIKILWQHIHDLWLRRNLDLHGHDASTREQAALHSAQREIIDLYLLRPLVRPADRVIFYSSTAEHFQQETRSSQLRVWLNTWKPMILSSAGVG